MVTVDETFIKGQDFKNKLESLIDESDLSVLTPKEIRHSLEEHYELEPNTLKQDPWKNMITNMIDEYILKKQSSETSVKEEESNHSTKRKRTEASPAVTEEDDEGILQKKRARKTKQVISSSDEEDDDQDDDMEEEEEEKKVVKKKSKTTVASTRVSIDGDMYLKHLLTQSRNLDHQKMKRRSRDSRDLLTSVVFAKCGQKNWQAAVQQEQKLKN
ncbi:hypothetical protein BCV72DRAFT_220479 [Rhizopus microsporus var. microsporus]|uniref:DEK-C domain-containing protein n=1 Tax=Rhizopus microsporus var. microsporus TaxID=86635 RepID=A0A1X0RG48_RHIZD|nr:hypothetical protein BCV72DRAFT_220479 [Rhizopus microsporus var. microsporus]